MIKVIQALVIALLVLLLVGGGMGIKYQFFPCHRDVVVGGHSPTYKGVWCR